jgi:hypothetical protein
MASSGSPFLIIGYPVRDLLDLLRRNADAMIASGIPTVKAGFAGLTGAQGRSIIGIQARMWSVCLE